MAYMQRPKKGNWWDCYDQNDDNYDIYPMAPMR